MIAASGMIDACNEAAGSCDAGFLQLKIAEGSLRQHKLFGNCEKEMSRACQGRLYIWRVHVRNIGMFSAHDGSGAAHRG